MKLFCFRIYIPKGSPSVPHPSQFNTSVPYKKTLSSTHPPQTEGLSSTQKNPQFHTKNPSVPPPQFHTKNPSVPHETALYYRALQFFSLRQRMLYEMAESLINSIDYEHTDVQEKMHKQVLR